jgi:hypothetical protein
MTFFTVETWKLCGKKTGESQMEWPRFTKGTVRDMPKDTPRPTRCKCGSMWESEEESRKCWGCGEPKTTEG